ncbi:ABC transporter permease [Microbacterium sp. zg-Y818]|uniref:ABC transporter permease n=1 Tax=Microbacterium sp. zg-Y818 TaxID=3049072 RepID=UPI00214C38F4|nr:MULTISPECIES: ABC transporter permease [unclassified Microbacterium]MCR2802214.1 ABC transporter permease [Microbacterium sp. zg.Y818]MCR2826376.1 ABC transporter permease [Microbacterium sp. zg.Y909]WIM23982.1 ABC transporter permease [Microbacterium sp. zg-Y818]
MLAAKTQGGFWRDVFRRLRRNPTAWIGAAIIFLFVAVSVLAPWLAPYPETALPGARSITPTSIPGPGEIAEFPLGLDRFGGDVLSKLIWGARASLLIGVISTAFGLAGGALLGLIAGTFGGWVDNVVMRFVDILLSVPTLLLAVSIAAVLGQSQLAVMIAIGASQVPIFARLLRASMLQQRSSDYVLSAQTLGLGRGRITMSHVLPNSVGPVIVQGTLTLATAVIDAAALSFLGLGGGRPETAEWGRMLTYAQAELAIAPWLAFLPGICIAVTALGFTLLGESLREAMDPRTRAR